MAQPVQSEVQTPLTTVPKVTLSVGATLPRLPQPSLNVRFTREGIGVSHLANVVLAGSGVVVQAGPVVLGTVIVCVRVRGMPQTDADHVRSMVQPVQSEVQTPLVTLPRVTLSVGATLPKRPQPSLNVKLTREGIGASHLANVLLAGSGVVVHAGPVVARTRRRCVYDNVLEPHTGLTDHVRLTTQPVQRSLQLPVVTSLGATEYTLPLQSEAL
jgi:hypothetical protein